MDDTIVIGVFVDEQALEEIKKRLGWMLFDERDISFVLGSDFNNDRVFAGGPLRGLNKENIDKKLIHFGLTSEVAKEMKDYMQDGGAMVAVSCPEEYIEDVNNLFWDCGAAYVETSE